MSTTGFGAKGRLDPAHPAVTEDAADHGEADQSVAGGSAAAQPETGPAPVDETRAAEAEPKPARSRATRIADGAILGGVCTGLARHLGWPVLVIRVGFVGLLAVQFLGAIAYGALWLLLPPEQEESAPGLEAASRTGMRTAVRPARRVDWGTLLALGALATGVLWLVQFTGWGISGWLFWPVTFACAGAALVWRQADLSQQQSSSGSARRSRLAPLAIRGGLPAVLRVVVELALVALAFSMVIAQQNLIKQLPEVMAMTVLVLAGLAVVVAPWLYRSRTALSEARAEKVLADARADMAAHLHDSVLQTLALIQRQADDPKAVQQLARRQERELRGWLYGEQHADKTLKAALTTAAAEVEDERGVPIEVVMVGDCEVTESLVALVRAAREALVNAAKHSGAGKIDVYAEVDEDTVEVFVRDRGAGFDLAEVDDDRLGVKHSIIDRMSRHGGSARIRTAPGEGTEVRLEINR